MPEATEQPVSVQPLRVLDEKFVANEVVFRIARPALAMVMPGDTLRRPDGSVDADLIRGIVAERIVAVPASTQRMMRVALGLATPAWVPAGPIDINWHVTVLPGVHPAGPDANILSGAANRLDAHRPLWSITVADLGDGRIAVIGMIHHSVGDGIQGIEMISGLLTDAPASPGSGSAPVPTVLGRAPRNQVELLRGHYTSWRSRHSTGAEARHDFLRKPFRKRLKRVGGRLIRPLKNLYLVRSGLADRMVKPRNSRMLLLSAAAVRKRARHLGATPTVLTVSAALAALAALEPDAPRYALTVPLSLGREAAARNHISMVRVVVEQTDDLASLVASVSDQLGSAVKSGTANTVTPRDWAGYASHLPMHPRRQYFGPAEVTSITLWPVLDLDDRIAVFTTTYASSFAVAVIARTEIDIDTATDAVARVFDTTDRESADTPAPAETSQEVPSGV
jgi:diacylglycerol O-acyltransferase